MGKPIQHIVWILTLNNQSFKALSMALKGLKIMHESIKKHVVTLKEVATTEAGKKYLDKLITLTPEEEKIWAKIQAQEQSLFKLN